MLFQQLEIHQNVQQHFGAANGSLYFACDLLRGASLANGAEYVEFQGRQNGAAGHKAADHVVDVIRQHAGCILALQHGEILVAMVEDLALHLGVGNSLQASDLLSRLQMRRYDPRHVVRGQLRIPGALGINDHHRSAVANSQTAATRDLDIVAQSLAAKFAMQGVENAERACCGAAGNSFSFFLCADENMMTKRFHGDLQSQLPVVSCQLLDYYSLSSGQRSR